MKVTKTEIRFKTGFQQPKTGLPKKPVLTSLDVFQPFERCLPAEQLVTLDKSKYQFLSFGSSSNFYLLPCF